MRRALALAALAGLADCCHRLVVSGALTLDTGWGRTWRVLGPFGVDIAAPRDIVFDVIATPYLGRTPTAMAGKLQVVERGSDLVLAAHHTPVRPGLVATTLETVRFERPHRVDFRLVRGPVPAVLESFVLTGRAGGTRLDYAGELGADLWGLGRWWGERVAGRWEAAVRASVDGIRTEAERRNRAGSR